MVGRLMPGQPRQAERNEVEISRVDDPVEGQDRPPRGEGGLRGQDHEGCGDAAQAHAAGMFVEIAKDHRRPHRVTAKCRLDRIQLAASGRPQEAKVDSHQAQRRRRIQIYQHGTPRLMPRQVKMFDPAEMNARPRQKRIAVPAEAYGIAADGQRLQPGHRDNPVARQGRGAVAQPSVSLLQRHDVCPKCCDPGQHAVRIAASVGADRLVDVPRGNPQDRL